MCICEGYVYMHVYIFSHHLAIPIWVVVRCRQRLMISTEICCALFAEGALTPRAGLCLCHAMTV